MSCVCRRSCDTPRPPCSLRAHTEHPSAALAKIAQIMPSSTSPEGLSSSAHNSGRVTPMHTGLRVLHRMNRRRTRSYWTCVPCARCATATRHTTSTLQTCTLPRQSWPSLSQTPWRPVLASGNQYVFRGRAQSLRRFDECLECLTIDGVRRGRHDWCFVFCVEAAKHRAS